MLTLINPAMSAPQHTTHLPEETSQVCANRCAEKSAIKAGVEIANTEYVDYLKQMITSLLENQMNLSAALDETREACAQLNLQKSELEASSTQEVQVLQAELSMCRQREAEMTLAYEDLRSRVEAIDQVIEQVRKVESRCKGLTRRQNEQELRMNEKEKEIERLLSQERELRNDLRNWQQRVFQLEAETQEIRHNCQIAELEMKSRLLEASILAADPTAKASLHNPVSLFSEDLIRIKATDEPSTPTTTTPSTATINTPIPVTFRGCSQEDASRPPKFSRPSLQGRPRFASTTSLSRLPLASTCQSQKNTSRMSRPASSLQLHQPSGGGDGVSCRGRSSILTTSFGSLSELELTADV